MTYGSPGRIASGSMNCLWFTGEPAGVLQSQDFQNLENIGVQLFINITGVREGGSVKIRLLGKDPASETYFTLFESKPLVGPTVFERMTLYPGMPYDEGRSVSDVLPTYWAVQAEIAGEDTAVSGTVGASVRGV
jgi:hypothetical protein